MPKNFKDKLISCTLFLLCLSIGPLFGDTFVPLQRFQGTVPGSPAFGSGYGTAVHIHQNEKYLFVSAPFARSGGLVASGVVYVYKKDCHNFWNLIQIIETKGVSDHLGGFEVLTQGKWLFISSIGTPIDGTSVDPEQDLTGSISIYKFEKATGQWEFKQFIDMNTPGLGGLSPSSPQGLNVTLPAFLFQQGASFGLTFAVDVRQGLMLVGAEYQQNTDPSGNLAMNSGSVFALKLKHDKWTFLQEIKCPDGSFANNTFGANVEMYDDLALISNSPVAQIPRIAVPPFFNPPLPRTNGTVYVYQFKFNKWLFIQKLVGDQVNPTPIPFSPLFCNCAGQPDCPVPCPLCPPPFQCIDTNTQISDSFGSSLAINKNWAVIGSGLEQLEPNGPLSGAVYFYRIQECSGKKKLVRKQKVVSNDPTTQGTALHGLAILRDTVLISDPLHTGPNGEAQQGAILVYNLKKGKWVQKATLFDPQGSANGFFGFSVYATDHYVVGGSSVFTTGLLFGEFGNPLIPPVIPFQDGSVVLYKRNK